MLERVPTAPRDELTSGWGFHVSDAAVAGPLCFGPSEGASATFVHTADRLPPQRVWEPGRRSARPRAGTPRPAARPGLG
ncbi:MAG: hypothetical protein ACYC1P_02105, partial [Gaiellaceae bacterium]